MGAAGNTKVSPVVLFLPPSPARAGTCFTNLILNAGHITQNNETPVDNATELTEASLALVCVGVKAGSVNVELDVVPSSLQNLHVHPHSVMAGGHSKKANLGSTFCCLVEFRLLKVERAAGLVGCCRERLIAHDDALRRCKRVDLPRPTTNNNGE